MTTRAGETYDEQPRLGVVTTVAITTQAPTGATSRLLTLLLDEFLDRPAPPGPLFGADHAAATVVTRAVIPWSICQFRRPS